ncbi:MAG: phosphatidylserine/phosphatidylglycerophosphate/cardiolipin synthase family protein [Woeseiaceae bacterium]|nr:phosphatidylserine/phosphatidylglycerophosphate/cardiolipin synthase family protein [Woeseiaceae bacterium]
MSRGFGCLRTVAFALVCGCLGACASAPGVVESDSRRSDPVSDGHLAARRVAGVTQSALLYARSVHVEPVVRPVSYLATGGSLLLKSAGGALRRIAINTVAMPSLDGRIPETVATPPMDRDAWEAMLDRVTGTRQTRGTIRFLVGGEAYFARLIDAIRNAESTIDIRTYIFDNDDYAVAVAQQLMQRARDDVRVRVMFDTLGNLQAMQVDPDTLPRDHRPPLSMALYLQQQSGVRVRTTANPWLVGDHTKTTIIDRQVAFIGGMNIGREYRYDWHDLMVEVRGAIVGELQYESDKAWSRAGPLGDVAGLFTLLRGRPHGDEDFGYPVRVLQTRNFDSDIYKAQIAAIQNAQRYILIENAYFSDDRTLYELARARRRGVDVRVIIPERGNHGPMNASNRVAINQMLEHGIRVYRYPGMSHVKAAIFDGWVCVGSANFDKLSLSVNRELNIATSEPEVAEALLRQVFIPDLLLSEEVLEPVSVTFASKLAEIIADEAL